MSTLSTAFNRHSLKLKSIAIASVALAGLSFTVASVAMPPMDGSAQCMMKPGHRAMPMMFDLSPLKSKLTLTPEQLTLWNKAEQIGNEQRNKMHDMHSTHRQHHDELKKLLNDDNANPRQFFDQTKQMHAEHQKFAESGVNAWLDVYDALDATQKKTARQFLLTQMDKHEQHHGKMKGMFKHGDKKAELTPDAAKVQ